MSQYYEPIEPNVLNTLYVEYSVDPGSYVSMHWHNTIEIICVLEGSLTLETEKQFTDLKAGDFIVIAPNELHAALNPDGNTSILIQIPIQRPHHLSPELLHRSFAVDMHTTDERKLALPKKIWDNCTEIYHTYRDMPFCYALRLEWLISESLHILYTEFSVPAEKASTPETDRNRERIQRVFQYTWEHYSEPVTLDEIASMLHLQKNYFCRLFRETTGMTYLEYLNDYRMGKLYHDLILTDSPIRTLLEKHGFTNYPLFRRLFAERFHKTPSEIRRQTKQIGNKNENILPSFR